MAPSPLVSASRFINNCKQAVSLDGLDWRRWYTDEQPQNVDELGTERRPAGQALAESVRIARDVVSLSTSGPLLHSSWADLQDEAAQVLLLWHRALAHRLAAPIIDMPPSSVPVRDDAIPPNAHGVRHILNSLVKCLASTGLAGCGTYSEALFELCGLELLLPQSDTASIGCLFGFPGGASGRFTIREVSLSFGELYPSLNSSFMDVDNEFACMIERVAKVVPDLAGRAPNASLRWSVEDVEGELDAAGDDDEPSPSELDKGTRIAGPSLGAAMATCIVAATASADFEVHERIAITGDLLLVNGKPSIGSVGDESSKLRGAAEAGIELVLVPPNDLEEWRTWKTNLSAFQPELALPLIRAATDFQTAMALAWRYVHLPGFTLLPPDELFGRASELQAVRSATEGDGFVVLYGPSGRGKTAIATTVLEDGTLLEAFGDRIVKAPIGRSPDPVELESIALQLLETLKIPLLALDANQQNGLNIDALVGLLSIYLTAKSRLLVLLDDVLPQDLDLVLRLVPEHHCSVIITTTDATLSERLREKLANSGRRVTPVPVEPLDYESARTLVGTVVARALRASPRAKDVELFEDRELDEIVAATDQSPKALLLLGSAVVSEVPATQAERARWLRPWLEEWQTAGQGLIVSSQPIASAKVAQKAVGYLSHEARGALEQIAAVFMPHPAWFERDAAIAVLNDEENLGELFAKSMITSLPGNKITIHPMVAEEVREAIQDPSTQKALRASAARYYDGQICQILDNYESYGELLGLERGSGQHLIIELVRQLQGLGNPRLAAASFSHIWLWIFWWWDYYSPTWRIATQMLDLVPDSDDEFGEMARRLRILHASYVRGHQWLDRRSETWRAASEALTWVGELLDEAIGLDENLTANLRVSPQTRLQVARCVVDLMLSDCHRYEQPPDLEASYCFAVSAHDRVVEHVPDDDFDDGWSNFYMADVQAARGLSLEAFSLCRAAREIWQDDELLGLLERVMADVAIRYRNYEAALQCLLRAATHSMSFHYSGPYPDAYTRDFHREMNERVASLLTAYFAVDDSRAIAAAAEARDYLVRGASVSYRVLEQALGLSHAQSLGNLHQVVGLVCHPIPTEFELRKPSSRWFQTTKRIVEDIKAQDPLVEDPIPAWQEIVALGDIRA